MFLRAHIFQTTWWILFIFGMIIDTVPKFYSTILCSCLWPQGQYNRFKSCILMFVLRPHIFQTIWWILFIFEMMIYTVPKFYSAILTALAHSLKDKVKKIYITVFKSSYFPNHMIFLVHIWNDIRFRPKVVFIITPSMPMTLRSRSQT